MIDEATAAALRDLTLRQSRPCRTFLEDLVRVSAMLAPLGRDGMNPIGYTSMKNGHRDHYGRAPMQPLRLPYGRVLRPWDEELRRVIAFTGRECAP
jgi:hypothetical protein